MPFPTCYTPRPVSLSDKLGDDRLLLVSLLSLQLVNLTVSVDTFTYCLLKAVFLIVPRLGVSESYGRTTNGLYFIDLLKLIVFKIFIS